MASKVTHKTPQLMKLLTGSPSASNPLLDEDFKAEVIRAVKNPAPVVPQEAKDGGTEINITNEIVTEWLPKIMNRFNVCRCARCKAEATVAAFDRIKPVIVRVKSDSDIQRATEIKSERQQPMIMQMIGVVAARKGLERHDK